MDQLELTNKLLRLTKATTVDQALYSLERLNEYAKEILDETGMKPSGTVANDLIRAIHLYRSQFSARKVKPAAMQIVNVGYGRTINTGNYEAVRYYLEAEVGAEDVWQDCVKSLDEEIDNLERVRNQVLQSERERFDELESRIETYQETIKGLSVRLMDATELLKKHGVDPAAPELDLVPAAAGEMETHDESPDEDKPF